MCFTLGYLIHLLVVAVVIVGIVLLLRLLVPYLLAQTGTDGAVIMRAVNIVIAVVVIIAVLWLIYDLVTCVWLWPGMGYSRQLR